MEDNPELEEPEALSRGTDIILAYQVINTHTPVAKAAYIAGPPSDLSSQQQPSKESNRPKGRLKKSHKKDFKNHLPKHVQSVSTYYVYGDVYIEGSKIEISNDNLNLKK